VRTRRLWLYLLITLLGVSLTYALAWYRASRLTERFLQEAAASYQAGRYLEALLGYETFDKRRRRYVYHGGYIQIEAIWADPFAWPRHPGLKEVRSRIVESINRLSLEEAEEFVRSYSGKVGPYLGWVFLRLARLYGERGEVHSARELLEEVPELFPHELEVIEEAKRLLERIGP
jgi:tetratricopeptide (TPR) repeat protein